MIKKLVVMAVLTGSAFTLTGCDFTTEDIKSAIEQCKADEECAALINNEIDTALEERGIYPEGEREFHHGRGYELPELTEEEQGMLDTYNSLYEELDAVFENMTDADYLQLELNEIEKVLGRELTTDEVAAYQLVNELYTSFEENYVDPFEQYDTEQAFLEAMLQRELTSEELAAFDVLEEMYETESDYEEFTEAQEAALEIIDGLYEAAYDAMVKVELEATLGRELTQEELSALELVKTVDEEYFNNLDDIDYENIDFVQEEIEMLETLLNRTLTEQEVLAIEFMSDFDFFYPYEDFDDYDYDYELTEEEEALWDTFEALEDEFFQVLDNMTDEELMQLEIQEMEASLGRELTEDELAAIQLLEDLYSSIDENNYVDPFEQYDTEQEFIEAVLARELTQTEIDALAVLDDLFENHAHHEELTEEQEAAMDIVDGLYEEVHNAMVLVELEVALERQLTDEELSALNTVKALEEEFMNNFDETNWDEYDFVHDQIEMYETVLNRELTDEELAAVEFVLNNDFFFPFEDFEDCDEVEIEGSPTV